jgi:DNA-directed RNA polymerase specialized sigma24 family protein
MSYREISAVMNLPETTIETRVTRGRKKLRELLERSREVETKLHAAMQH